MSPQDTKPDLKVILAFLAVTVLLGVNFVAVRFSNFELGPFWGAALRFLTAAVVLVSIMKVKNIPFPKGAAMKSSVLYGVLSFGFSYALIYWALLYVSSGTTAVIFSLLPLATLFIASVLGIEKLNKRNVAGSIVAFAGIYVIYSSQFGQALPLLPLLAILLSVGVSAYASVLVKKMVSPNPVALNAVGMGTGSLVLLIGSIVANESLSLPKMTATWLALGWLIMSSVIAFILFVWIIKKWTASATTYALVLAPLVAIALGAVLVREPVTARMLIGSSLALLGVYVGAMKYNSPKKRAV